mmetsp:Transcript_97416/g.160308  ORF Transcript_97416/g.160308 Transcript_97416/m.160308 type:complete len:247 (+) Transcript_97416:76-816(+)
MSARLLPEDSPPSPGKDGKAGPQMAVRTSERFTVAVMGRSGVGKSAITLRYTNSRFVREHDPTIEDTHLKHTTISGIPVCLNILDTAGQETYRPLRRSWMKQDEQPRAPPKGFLFVFSLIDRQTFDELKAFYDELMDLYHNNPPPSVLVANKADHETREWAVGEDEVRKLRASWSNCRDVVYTSAKSDQHVQHAFESLCIAIREFAAEQRSRPSPRQARPILPDPVDMSDSRCTRKCCRHGSCTVS